MMSRKGKEEIYFKLFKFSGFITAIILVIVILYIIIEGAGVIDWSFLTSMWEHREITQGGILTPLIGSVLLAFGIAAFSIPTGMITAIYLNEYAEKGKIVRAINISIRNLAGVPSIVYGLFGLAVFVGFFGFGRSLLSAWLTLSAMTLPWTITASQEALENIPDSFREASLALGASKWETIKNVILPQALPGMLTGSILGLARAMGETAPLLLVGGVFYMNRLPNSPLSQFMALPYHTYILAAEHSHELAINYAAGTAIILILIVFGISMSMILIRRHYQKKRKW